MEHRLISLSPDWRNHQASLYPLLVSAQLALRYSPGARLFPSGRRAARFAAGGCNRHCARQPASGWPLAAAIFVQRENLFRTGTRRVAEPLDYTTRVAGVEVVGGVGGPVAVYGAWARSSIPCPAKATGSPLRWHRFEIECFLRFGWGLSGTPYTGTALVAGTPYTATELEIGVTVLGVGG